MESLSSSQQIHDVSTEAGSNYIVDAPLIHQQAVPVRIVISKELTIPRIISPQVKIASERATGRGNIYHPSIISIGPYHHGKPELRRAEVIKQQILDSFISESHITEKSFYYNKIFDKISQIRVCYEELHYTDQKLAEIMLCDACFLIHYLKHKSRIYTDILHYFGATGLKFVHCDIWMLENQIPLWVIKLLCCCHPYDLPYCWDVLFNDFIHKVHWENVVKDKDRIVNECFHLLHMIRFVERMKVKSNADDDLYNVRKTNFWFRSITSLKAKGILFKPTNKQEISFTSHSLHGILELPVMSLQFHSFTKYSNIIAYEMSRVGYENPDVTSYISFLKSLIQSPNDVKELREIGILCHLLDNDEEVVKLLKDIDCVGFSSDMYSQLNESIERHCSSRTKTWRAGLISAFIQNPLIAIAMFAVLCLISLAFIQTYYTIRRVR